MSTRFGPFFHSGCCSAWGFLAVAHRNKSTTTSATNVCIEMMTKIGLEGVVDAMTDTDSLFQDGQRERLCRGRAHYLVVGSTPRTHDGYARAHTHTRTVFKVILSLCTPSSLVCSTLIHSTTTTILFGTTAERLYDDLPESGSTGYSYGDTGTYGDMAAYGGVAGGGGRPVVRLVPHDW